LDRSGEYCWLDWSNWLGWLSWSCCYDTLGCSNELDELK
jgi:hypothetical protein